jgi:hypothetical protein
MASDERVLAVIPGARGQALVALDRRALTLKSGFDAGTPFRVRAHSFDYERLAGLEIERGSALAVVWLVAKDGRPPEKQWWQSVDPARDPFRSANAVPVEAETFDRCEAELRTLREAIAGTGPDDREAALVDELERLAALRAAGALSDEEFAHTKRHLLEG